jgi:hypothetical protein
MAGTATGDQGLPAAVALMVFAERPDVEVTYATYSFN